MNNRRNLRSEANTIPTVTLPPAEHGIWTMGFKHVQVAHAVCSAFFRLTHCNR